MSIKKEIIKSLTKEQREQMREKSNELAVKSFGLLRKANEDVRASLGHDLTFNGREIAYEGNKNMFFGKLWGKRDEKGPKGAFIYEMFVGRVIGKSYLPIGTKSFEEKDDKIYRCITTWGDDVIKTVLNDEKYKDEINKIKKEGNWTYLPRKKSSGHLLSTKYMYPETEITDKGVKRTCGFVTSMKEFSEINNGVDNVLEKYARIKKEIEDTPERAVKTWIEKVDEKLRKRMEIIS